MNARLGPFTRQMAFAVTAAWACLATSSDGFAQQPSARPFEDIYRRPNVSPYLQLEQQGWNPLQTQNIYQTTVQPRMQQQRQQIEQLQQRRQMGQMQNQMRQMQQSSQARQIDEMIRPTGHASTYMNYSHYYQMR